MNVELVDLTPCKKLLKVEFDGETVKKELETVTAQCQKSASIKGFRSGHAPLDMVAKLYEGTIRDRARQNLLEKGFRDAVKEKNLRAVGSPRVEEDSPIEADKPFSFNLVVEVAPTFDLPEYKGIEITVEKRTIGDAEMARAMTVLRERMCSYKDKEQGAPAEDKDVAVINYTCTCEGKPVTDIVPSATRIAKANNFWVRITKDSFLPGFTEQLIGLKGGDKKNISVDFPADFVEPDLAGKKGDFEVEVVMVKQVELPEENDEFAKLYGAKSLEELKNNVRSDMEYDAKYKEKQSIENQISKALLDKVSFDVPESALEQETLSIVENVVRQNRERKVREEVIQKRMGEIRENASKQALGNMRMGFIVSKIAEAEKIKVTEREIQNRIAFLAQVNKIPMQKLVKQLRENNGITSIASDIITGKVMELLKLHAVVKEVPAPAEA